MPQWTVEGADKRTGKDVTVLVEAPNADAARLVASKQGLAVAGITPSEQHETVEATQLSYRSIPLAAPASSRKSVRRAVFVLNIIAIAAYVAAAGELFAQVLFAMPGRQTPGQTLVYASGGLFAAVKSAGFGALFQVGATLLQLLADRLAGPRS